MNSKTVFIAAVMVTITLGTKIIVFPSYAQIPTSGYRQIAESDVAKKAPVVISGSHVYIVWFTNEGTVNSNFEVGFRASNDSGATFGPIMIR